MKGEIRSYYRQVSGWLPCGGVHKRRIMARIRSNVNGYLAQNPEAGPEQLRAHFGEPKDIAAAYVSDLDTGELLAALRIRRRIAAAVLAAVMFIAVTWGVSVLWAIEEAKASFGGHYETGLVEGEWREGMKIDWTCEYEDCSNAAGVSYGADNDSGSGGSGASH